MPQTVYMQRHSRHDHGFTIPDPLLTQQFGVPNACNKCHTDKSTDWALKAVDTWYGAKMERPTRTRAQIIARARAGEDSSRTNLVQLLATEPIPYWRAVAAGLLGNWEGDTNVQAALLRGLEDTNALVRAVTARTIEPLAENESVAAALRSKLTDPLRDVRIWAAWDLRATLDTNSLAGRDLLQMLTVNADQPAGQLQWGNFYFARGDLEAACQHMQTAVSWDAFSTPLRLELAVVLSALNRTPEAVTQLQAACKNAPKDAQAHFSLGLALNDQGQAAQAQAELEAAVGIDPHFARAWYNLGLLQNAGGDALKAIHSLLQAESADPQDPRIPFARATILARMGRGDDARLAAQQALKLDPNFTAARQLLQQLDGQ
jgi:tetratricopeptide (TPR) repeat protein